MSLPVLSRAAMSLINADVFLSDGNQKYAAFTMNSSFVVRIRARRPLSGLVWGWDSMSFCGHIPCGRTVLSSGEVAYGAA